MKVLDHIAVRMCLFQVWDGTKCAHPLLNVAVAPEALEGEPTNSQDRENLTANILVFDNHVELARTLKVRDKTFHTFKLNITVHHKVVS